MFALTKCENLSKFGRAEGQRSKGLGFDSQPGKPDVTPSSDGDLEECRGLKFISINYCLKRIMNSHRADEILINRQL